MSGHSKWSKVKHQKATTDVVKGAAFTKASRAITLAVREGGGIADPEKNFRLRLAIEKVVYEGYGPGGVAFMIEAATDNRNRTVSVVKNMFERNGGTLAGPGAVSFLFTKSVEQDQMVIRSTYTVPVTEEVRDRIDALIADLEALDDIQQIFTNVE